MSGSGQTNASEGRVVHQVNLLEYGTAGILGEKTPQKVQAPKRQGTWMVGKWKRI
jgi:hypothetical protein